MKTHLTAALCCTIAMPLAATVPARAATDPCEDMLKQLRTAEATATLSDADKAAVADLEAKGVERCNADDD